jgi:hypothetical protein
MPEASDAQKPREPSTADPTRAGDAGASPPTPPAAPPKTGGAAAGPAATPGAAPARGGAAGEPAGKGGVGFPPEPKTTGLAWLREVTTTVIAGVVVLVALTMLWRTFSAAPDFAQKKDVMLYGLTILGTVVGYYFGRVPAERRAETSERKATEAQDTAGKATTAAAEAQREAQQAAQAKDQAVTKLAQAKAGVERAKAALAPAAPTLRRTLGGEPPVPGAAADRGVDAFLELEVLSRQL